MAYYTFIGFFKQKINQMGLKHRITHAPTLLPFVISNTVKFMYNQTFKRVFTYKRRES